MQKFKKCLMIAVIVSMVFTLTSAASYAKNVQNNADGYLVQTPSSQLIKFQTFEAVLCHFKTVYDIDLSYVIGYPLSHTTELTLFYTDFMSDCSVCCHSYDSGNVFVPFWACCGQGNIHIRYSPRSCEDFTDTGQPVYGFVNGFLERIGTLHICTRGQVTRTITCSGCWRIWPEIFCVPGCGRHAVW